MQDLTVTTLCHPPHIKHLKEHLHALKTAIRDKGYKVILLNTQANDASRQAVDDIIRDVGVPNLQVIHIPNALPIGQSRNYLFDKAQSEWIMFTDADTKISHDYFDNLEKFSKQHNLGNVYALSGNIGAASLSKFGKFEALMDKLALVGTLEGINKDIYQTAFTNPNAHTIEQYVTQIDGELPQYSGHKIGTLQAFNQIVRKKVRTELGGCDERFKSADDRELAIRIRAAGKDILFVPECKVDHHYNFSLSDIQKRKQVHGLWAERVRQKYSDRPDVNPSQTAGEWAQYIISLVHPPEPYHRSLEGRLYYLLSTISYERGCLGAYMTKDHFFDDSDKRERSGRN